MTIKSVLSDLSAIVLGVLAMWLVLAVVSKYHTPAAPTVDPITYAVPLISCESMKVIYDKAYVEALPSSNTDVDWSDIDKVFYEKFKHCL